MVLVARKLFYNKRRKLPAFLQLYLAWFLIASISLSLFYYFGVVELKNSKPKLVALKTGPANYFGQQVRNRAKDWFKKKDRVAAVRKTISRSFSTQMNSFFKNYSYKNSLCNGFYLSPKQPNQNQFLIISEWKANLGRENTQVILALTQFLSQSNSNATSLLLVDNIEDCDFTEFTEEVNANTSGIIIVKEFHHNKSSIVLGTSKIASIQLSPYFIKADNSISKQVSASVYGALRFNSLSNAKVIANFKSSKTALKDLAPKLAGLISSLNPKQAESASFWVSSTRQLSSSFAITLYILFAVFIWLTYLNVTYKNQERLQIVEGIIATVYFSSVPLILYFSSSLLSKFIDDFTLWLTLTIILQGVLLWLSAYFKKVLFKLHVNLSTAILIYNSILLFIALKSASLFILIALTPQFFSMARRSHIIVSIILSVIALIPLIYITATGFSAIQTNLPIHQYFFTNLNTSFFQVVLIALGIGGAISLLNRSKS